MSFSPLVFIFLLLVTCVVGSSRAIAQPLRARLPTMQGGDYGNGAADSGVLAGAFASRTAPGPSIAFGIPTAFGAEWGDVFVIAGAQHGLRYAPRFNDAALFAGVGLGHASRWVGAEVTLANYDLVKETLKDGSWSVKLHRRLGPAALAVGVENARPFGTIDGGRSRYIVGSGVVPLRADRQWLPDAAVTIGVGDGRFTDWTHVAQGDNQTGLFGSAALRIVRRGSVLTTWTGQNLNVGASVSLRWGPATFVATPVLLDVAGPNRDRIRLALGTGVAAAL